MKVNRSITRFGRVVSSLFGESQPENASDILNFRLRGSKLVPRFGYANVATSPGASFESLGCGFVSNTAGVTELISIENRNGTVRPYLVNQQNFSRTQIGSEALGLGKWNVIGFSDHAYFISQTGPKTVWRHKIGDINSLTAVEDQNYIEPPDNPSTRGRLLQPSVLRRWRAASFDSYSYPIWDHTHFPSTISVAIDSEGAAVLSGGNDDDGPNGGKLLVQCSFGSASNMTGADYIYFKLEGLEDLRVLFPNSDKPRLKISGSWTPVDDAKFWFEGKEAVHVMYVKSMNLASVEGIEFSVNYDPERSDSSGSNPKKFLKIHPVMSGGSYLESSISSQRIWDNDLVGDGIRYGVRYQNSANLTQVSDIKEFEVSTSQSHGYFATTFSTRIGGIVMLSVDPPATPYDQVQFLRIDESTVPDPTWRVLATVNSGPFAHTDRRCEYEVPSLPAAGPGAPPVIPPVFRTSGIKYAFPYKQSMVWLTATGVGNIQISRVGNAEEIYDERVIYDEEDLTQPAQLTLADNMSDEPIWGAQCGAIAFIVGRNAAYAIVGDYPVSLSPSRQIPGSRGIAGPDAGVRFRPKSGDYAAAYMDSDANVWVVSSIPQYKDDAQGTPIELSLPVRGKIKQFLYDEQRGEFPDIKMDDVQLEVDENEGALWCVLGNRAAVFRQDMSGDGWEFYKYQLAGSSSSTTSSGWSLYSSGIGTPTSVARSGSTDAWVSASQGGSADGMEAVCSPLSPNDKSELLRSAGIRPTPLIPVSATLDKLRVRVKHASSGGIGVFHDHARLVLNGVPVGSNLVSTPVAVPASAAFSEFEIASPLPSGVTLAAVNAGEVGFEVGYVADSFSAAALTAGNWVISAFASTTLTGNNTTQPVTITATYIGGGSPPPYVFLDVLGTVTTGIESTGPGPFEDPDPRPYSSIVPGGVDGFVDVQNGLGARDAGPLALPATASVPSSRTATSTLPVRLAVSGGVATYSFTMRSDGNVNSLSHRLTSTYSASATIGTYVGGAVRVDAMEFSAYSTVTSSYTSGLSWKRGCFTPTGIQMAVRSSGELDLIEKDSRTGLPISGVNRDGGLPMPTAFWVSQDISFEGRKAWLSAVQFHTGSPVESVSILSSREGTGFSAGIPIGLATSRWAKFGPSFQGIRHRIRIEASEGLDALDGVVFEFGLMSRHWLR